MGTFHLSGHPSFGDIMPKGTFHFWGYIIYGDTPSVGEYHHLPMGTSHPREHSTSWEHGTGTSDLWGHTNYRSAPPKGTFHFCGYTIYGGRLTYGDIPILGNMVQEHRTYGDTPTIGKHHLRGHSTSGDTPSMGEYDTASGEAPHMGPSPYLLKRPTYGDIPPIGTS